VALISAIRSCSRWQRLWRPYGTTADALVDWPVLFVRDGSPWLSTSSAVVNALQTALRDPSAGAVGTRVGATRMRVSVALPNGGSPS